MKLHETLIAGVCLFVMTVLVMCGCSYQRQKVLAELPGPIVSIPNVHNYKIPSVATLGNERENSGRKAWDSSPELAVPAEWYPRVKERKWDSIIVHHSATENGSARTFDRLHRQRGWDELGYDFVIGNGTETPDGYIEIGPRWKKQKHGAHCKTPSNHYNNFGVGICLVGNFQYQYPSSHQLASLKKLILFLAKRYNIPAEQVMGHGEVPQTHTLCPGKHVNMRKVRSWVRNSNSLWVSAK